MKWTDLFTGRGAISDTIAIIDKTIIDKDQANLLKAQVYITELNTKTIPIVDAIHKMGRQTMWYVQAVIYFYCISHGIDITWEMVGGLSGFPTAYSVSKGKGK